MKTETGRTGEALRIGLTGGIASGKSLAADCFSERGVHVIDADKIAHQLLAPGAALVEQLGDIFAGDLVDEHGVLDRAKLRQLVFASGSQRQKLEALLHPPVLAAMKAAATEVDEPYVILVVPLLLEAGALDLVDRVLVIDCPVAAQIERLLLRDRIDRQLAERMLRAQATREERLTHADDVLENIGSPDEVQRLVAMLDAYYRLRAAHRPPQPGTGARPGRESPAAARHWN